MGWQIIRSAQHNEEPRISSLYHSFVSNNVLLIGYCVVNAVVRLVILAVCLFYGAND